MHCVTRPKFWPILKSFSALIFWYWDQYFSYKTRYVDAMIFLRRHLFTCASFFTTSIEILKLFDTKTNTLKKFKVLRPGGLYIGWVGWVAEDKWGCLGSWGCLRMVGLRSFGWLWLFGWLRFVKVGWGWVVEVGWGWVGGGPPLSLPSSASHHQPSLGSWVARDW